MHSFALIVAAVFAMVAAPALADKLPLPKASYSADITFAAKGHAYAGHIYVDGPKERRDIKDPVGVSTIKIIRRDEGKVYDLRPLRHLAVELRIAAAEAAGETGAPGTDIDSFYGADATPRGTETVAGLETTKYHVTMESSPGLVIDALVWSTDDGIIVRIIGKTSVDGDNSPARMELSNITRGPQDAALFEVPAGMGVLSPSKEGDSQDAANGGDAMSGQKK